MFVEVTTDSNVQNSVSSVSLVHESFSRLSEIISGQKVKSDWYGRPDSPAGINTNSIGGGALKAVLNGYELRSAKFPEQVAPRPIQLSFKDIFESMDAIDNIGWGFWEENGTLYLRVERWQWFYKDAVIMEIRNPNNVKRTLQSDRVYTRLKTGYSKYLDEQEINAIDTFHTEREYSTGIKAVDKPIEKMCKFIADPYAIETTRRQQFNKEEYSTCDESKTENSTENWKYDEDVFIVVLCHHFIDIGNEWYAIDTGADLTDGTIISPDTTCNFRISPERNAIRHAEIFFRCNSNRESLNFMSGTGNVEAKGKPDTSNPGWTIHYLDDSANGNIVSENQSIPKTIPLLKSEILSFEYPITFEHYAAILRNPYGKIIVDGEACYIQKITPSLMKGTASFELIPTANG